MPEKERHSAGAVIEARDLHKAFGEQAVLDGLTFSLAEGESLVVLGRSGTGKSVLLKTIVGLIEPDDGELSVIGHKVTEGDGAGLRKVRAQVGYLFQGGALYDFLNVRENLEFALRYGGRQLPEDEIRARTEDALAGVGLEAEMDKMPEELSGGMQKRVALARALVLRPKVMLYDEPTTGLDPITSREISKLMRRTQEKYAVASVVVTHDLQCAELTADRAAVLMDGRFAGEGSLAELKRSRNKAIRNFFNS